MVGTMATSANNNTSLVCRREPVEPLRADSHRPITFRDTNTASTSSKVRSISTSPSTTFGLGPKGFELWVMV